MKISNPTLALLGHGDFAEPTFEALRSRYTIASMEEADCLIVANYGKILSKSELARPKFGAINLHGSLLPKYRGAAPIQTALANGEIKTGVTIIKMDDKVDHGPMLGSAIYTIKPNDYSRDLYRELGLLAKNIILEILPNYFSNTITLQPQNEADATFTQKLTQKVYLKKTNTAKEKYNLVRAFSEEPGVWVKTSKGEFKIIKAKLINDQFVPEIIQRPGKKPLDYATFLHGFNNQDPFDSLTE